MHDIIAVILIAFGLILILVGVLAWLGIIKPQRPIGDAQGQGATFYDFLIALLDKAPWVVVVGLFLVVLGVTLLIGELPV